MQAATGRVIVGILWLTILVVVAGAWSAGVQSAKGAARQQPSAVVKPVVAKPVTDGVGGLKPLSYQEPSQVEDMMGEADGNATDEVRVDLYGNEIESAVSDYRVDFQGDIYESHAPEVVVGELADPSL
jgi:hypothetical protein